MKLVTSEAAIEMAKAADALVTVSKFLRAGHFGEVADMVAITALLVAASAERLLTQINDYATAAMADEVA